MIKIDIVTSLELSKELRDAGAKQRSCHSWFLNSKTSKEYMFFEHSPDFLSLMYSEDKLSAYTAEELSEFLPHITRDGIYTLEIIKRETCFEICYVDKGTGEVKHTASDKRLCEALGKLLLLGMQIKKPSKN